MTTAIDMAMIAALVGDPARANILSALTDGRAQTATELAYAARVSPQTTSGHLGKLTEARLLTLKKQGRHHYYRLASPLVGRMLEAVMAGTGRAPPPPPFPLHPLGPRLSGRARCSRAPRTGPRAR